MSDSRFNRFYDPELKTLLYLLNNAPILLPADQERCDKLKHEMEQELGIRPRECDKLGKA